MIRRQLGEMPADLARARERFAVWRAEHQPRSRIPTPFPALQRCQRLRNSPHRVWKGAIISQQLSRFAVLIIERIGQFVCFAFEVIQYVPSFRPSLIYCTLGQNAVLAG